ncbi:MAG: hypothetical protein ACPG8W_15145 [Candidatus Promineifilaceae bacterium]
MEENEFLRITDEDIAEANQLSLACPICAGPVENGTTVRELSPVTCVECNTLYHQHCWGNNGGKCAILGCNCTTCQPYGVRESVLTIDLNEVPTDAQISKRNKRLKRIERERNVRQPAGQADPPRSLIGRFFAFLFGSSNSAR